MKAIYTLFLLLLLTSLSAQEQPVDINSAIQSTDTVYTSKEQKVYNPNKALLLSAVVPGLGQIYNRQYIKLPIVYGGLGLFGYFINFNTTNYKKYKTAYRERLDCNCDPFSNTNLSANDIKIIRDRYRKQLEQSYIGLSLFYVGQVVDAYVSAHLKDFDVSDDISMQIKPSVIMTPETANVGIGLTFKLKE